MSLMEEMEKELEELKNITGKSCRKEIIKQSKAQLKIKRQETSWTIRTVKRLEKLIRKNPDVIYIYDYTDFEACLAEGNPASWVDVYIGLPFSFGRIQSVWVCTLLTKECFENDRQFAIKNGGEVFNLEDQFRYDQFENLYLDINSFNNEQDVIDGFREWVKIFIPELANKEIKYELKESFFLKDFVTDLIQNINRKLIQTFRKLGEKSFFLFF